MSLSIKEISFVHFRNYSSFYLSVNAPVTIFIGDNAVGKTNILEGIGLLSNHTSLRGANTDQLIQKGASEALLKSILKDTSRDLSLKIKISKNNKIIFLNEKRKKARDVKELIPSVSFIPDDLHLAKGSLSLRRKSIDIIGSQISKNYYIIRKDYEKVIEQKNRTLKESFDSYLLDSLNELVITCGSHLCSYRLALLERLSKLINIYYKELSNNTETLTIKYFSSWGDCFIPEIINKNFARECLMKSLEINKKNEISQQRSLIGPHRDKIEFYINKKEVNLFASQGQQRLVVLAYKLAQAQLIEDLTNQKPIFLFDDVMSEIDPKRRKIFQKYILNNPQSFITATDISYFDTEYIKNAEIVFLPYSDGHIRASNA